MYTLRINNVDLPCTVQQCQETLRKDLGVVMLSITVSAKKQNTLAETIESLVSATPLVIELVEDGKVKSSFNRYTQLEGFDMNYCPSAFVSIIEEQMLANDELYASFTFSK